MFSEEQFKAINLANSNLRRAENRLKDLKAKFRKARSDFNTAQGDLFLALSDEFQFTMEYGNEAGEKSDPELLAEALREQGLDVELGSNQPKKKRGRPPGAKGKKPPKLKLAKAS